MRFCGLFTLVFLVFASAFAGSAVNAQDEPSPQLQAAIDAWLADDDAAALPALSALAAAGDSRAALLLGEIERRSAPERETDWLRKLPSADRAALFRPAGAPLTETLAANGDALAQTLLAAAAPDATIETAHTLHAFGEVESARHLAWTMLESGKLAEVITMPAEEPLFRDLDWLWWMKGWIAGGAVSGQPQNWVLVSAAKGRAAGIIFANWSAQFIAAKTPLTPELSRLAKALGGSSASLAKSGPSEIAYAEKMVSGLARRDPAMRPLGAICKRLCEAELGACMLEGLRLVGGYGALMPLDTPVEGLISQSAFTTSKRAENAVERLIRATAPSAKGEPINQCLGQSVGG